MRAKNIPRSERLQKKVWETKDPGSEHHCKNRQQNLEELCEGIGKENESANSQSEKVITSKRKSIPNQTENTKRRMKVAVVPDSDNGMSDTDEMEGDLQDCEMEFELIRKERQMVNKLLKSSKKDEVEERIEYANRKFEELFQGVYKRLDNITGLLEKIAQGKEVEIGSSLKSCSTPTQAKVERKVAKKPTLYATALMSHMFTNEEMREGSVEPKESKGKKALDPTKISLIKKCIRAKFGDKVLERSWPEIRTSINQKCLDKLKQYRRVSCTDQSSLVKIDGTEKL
ncbi:hypothetical protein P5673_031272 [Acropora cervicornis]|uniref:BEN domain-containing protein n=1 Tax=Acropora cervicornis TaxID=6130 RepID=A0AAD9USN3_ACRCE|nr:hypothetical protein P5673_031272 [Acropora cervicornis]